MNRQLHVGTSERNYLLPEKIEAIEVEPELKKLALSSFFPNSTKDSGFNSTLINVLAALNLIDCEHTDLPYKHNEVTISKVQEADRNNLAIANFIERIEIESAGVSHLQGIRDGGLAAALQRKDFAIEILGDGRLAVSIFGALVASGFNSIQMKVAERLEVTNRDLVGGFLQKQNLGSSLSKSLLQLQSGSSIFPDSPMSTVAPALVISIGRPSPELLKNWLEAGIPQLFIDFEHPGLMRIGPFVKPGIGPCYNCIYLSEGESGSPIFGSNIRSNERKLELATSLVLVGAGVIAAEVARFAATGCSDIYKKSIQVSLANLYAPQVTSWERHPRCGCNWI